MVAKAWVVACVMACSCVSHRRPVPLYAASEKPASPDEVATLYGEVRDVDGKFVSNHGEGNVTNKFPPQSDEQGVVTCPDVVER